MDILKELKNLKKISPDASFSERSKNTILFSHKVDVFGFFKANAKAGFLSLAMMALVLFAAIHYISPTQITKVDPRSLKAEAQAIDLQIKLTNLNYIPSPADISKGSTVSGVSTATKISTSSAVDDSIDSALDLLSK